MSTEDGLSAQGRAALQCIGWGFGVFPVKARGKAPACAHGINEYSHEREAVEVEWRRHPDLNVGIACGAPSGGLLVLDFDVGEDKDGLATLKEWEKLHGELPDTAVAITGTGGQHHLYRTDRTGIHPSVNTELGVDIRSDGSYIVAPGSIHPNGEPYEWWASPDECGIADADANVYDFVDYVQRNGGTDEAAKKPNGKFKLPEEIKRGRRDETLFKYASHLRSIGRSDEEILLAVSGVNATRCEPPMDSRDVARICKSACRYEQGDGVSQDGGPLPRVPNGGVPACPRGPRGGIKTNEVAKIVVQRNMARIIDGAPAVWTGKRWEFGVRAINRCTLEIADDAKKQDKAEVVSYIMDKAPSVSSDSAFDGRHYVQFADCTYDVLAGTTVEPAPSMFIVATLPVRLNMGAPRNAADEFFESVSDGDEATAEAMKEVLGACMCSARVLSQSPMLIGRAGGASGKASNGKSTYLNWVRSIIGPENTSSLDIATLGQRFQAGRVVGKLANLGDDIPDGFLRGDELSVFKKLVTGDSIYTDVKGGDGFEFRPTASMVFSMNEVPRLSDTTDGVFRRLAFIPFRRRFAPGEPGYDPDVARKLAQPEALERGALLGLIALEALVRRGALPVIPDMAAEVEEVRQANDSVLRWLFDESVDAEWLSGRTVESVYKHYCDWCDEAGERAPYARRTWTAKVVEAATFGHRKALEIQARRVANSPKKQRTFVICETQGENGNV